MIESSALSTVKNTENVIDLTGEDVADLLLKPKIRNRNNGKFLC